VLGVGGLVPPDIPVWSGFCRCWAGRVAGLEIPLVAGCGGLSACAVLVLWFCLGVLGVGRRVSGCCLLGGGCVGLLVLGWWGLSSFVFGGLLVLFGGRGWLILANLSPAVCQKSTWGCAWGRSVLGIPLVDPLAWGLAGWLCRWLGCLVVLLCGWLGGGGGGGVVLVAGLLAGWVLLLVWCVWLVLLVRLFWGAVVAAWLWRGWVCWVVLGLTVDSTGGGLCACWLALQVFWVWLGSPVWWVVVWGLRVFLSCLVCLVSWGVCGSG